MAGEACTLSTGLNPVDQAKPAENIEEEIVELVRIYPEFRGLIPSLNPAEKEELKRSLQKEGCRDKLVVCRLDGEYVLLDGHNRYDICQEIGIPFETKEIAISDRTEAKIWIIKNQRGRRNLDESQRAMLAVALEALYAEEAKNRQGTRTDLGKNLDKSEVGRSAEKAAKDMGVSRQTVCFAKKVSTKGIPDLAKLVNSGKVAVSAASKATSLPTESQAKVVEKVEEQIKDGKHVNLAAIIREIAPKTSENDAEERFEKSKKNLVACVKLLDGIDATQSQDKLAEMLELLEKLTARLKEIGATIPNPAIQNVIQAFEDHQIEVNEETYDTNSGSLAPVEDDEETDLADSDSEYSEDNPSNSMDDSTRLPDGWEAYEEAIEKEMSIERD